MTNELRKTFLELKVTGQRFVISPEDKKEKDLLLIAYLHSLIENKSVTEFEDIGFCYWNISDNYALLRDGPALYDNHKKFCTHISNKNESYWFWLVCDATQRLTLEKGGYENFWWNLYTKAVEQNQNNKQYFAEFNAHRAAMYTNNSLTSSQHNLNYARINYEKFLAKTESTPEYDFYTLIYLSLISKFSTVNYKELLELCEPFIKYLQHSKKQPDFLVGEWKGFITPFEKREQAVIGITAAINTLIYSNNITAAKDLYFEACNMGLPQNHYIETRLKTS